ncbi:MAG: transporter substrate-binding domain-containing protein [Nitrospirales bacterium]
MKKYTFHVGLTLLAMAFLLNWALLPLVNAAEGSKSRTSPGTLARIVETGTLRVGVSLFTPWAIKQTDGQLVGFEIDVAKQLAKDLGVKPEFHVLEWEKIMPALLKREIDIIAAGMVITPQRALKVNFSQPYDSSGIGLVTNIPLTKTFNGPQDLNKPEVTIIAVTGTISEDVARRVFPNATIKTVSSSQEAIKAVAKGKVHAYVEHEPITTFIALDNPETVDEPLSKPLLETREGFAVNKGDPDFIHFLNAWIVSHEADVWLSSAHKYWFEGVEWRKDLATNP